MDEIKAKQQVVEKIQEATKILVTVSDSPSVDALSAALGLAMILDKQQKYATAIFSGQTPPAIAFLEPEKTFDDTTDSLRDFIIALNKEKADHLRYKVEGDSVKIFITPYKTTINQDDLTFSQGDYNVELVIALGVNDHDHLDAALENHGQILHDAAIITMTAGDQTSDLGGVDWHDSSSSSLSEMVAGLAEALKDDKKKTLLDGTIATALLTGIVAETDRFSNEHTTSRVMTVAASLMAAGADQQLIANELQNLRKSKPDDNDTSGSADTPDAKNDSQDDQGTISVKKDTIEIDHSETLAELDKRVLGEEKAKEKIEEEIEAVTEEAEDEADKREKAFIAGSTPHPVYAAPEVDEPISEPSFGGTLSATAEQAADDARNDADNDQNKTILSHAYLGSETPTDAPAAPGSVGVNDLGSAPAPDSAYSFDNTAQPSDAPTLAVGGERTIEPLSAPPSSAPTPTDLGLPLPPPLPDFSQIAVPAPAIPLPPSPEQPAILGDILTSEPAQPAAGTPYAFEPEAPASALPPMPEPTPEAPIAPMGPPPVIPPAAPGQFQIPGQPQ